MYGISLRDVVADLCSDHPTCTPWWVLVLVEELGDDSAFTASRRGGPEYRGWTFDRYLAAASFDATQIQTVVIAKSAGAKNAKMPAPLPRPGQARPASAGTGGKTLMKLAKLRMTAVAKTPPNPNPPKG